MSAKVKLTFANGMLKGCHRVVERDKRITVGRGPLCDLRLPKTGEFLRVSRKHCELEVHPPRARIRDLGSLNGTFVNGVSVGEAGPWAEEKDQAGNVWRNLHDGDEIRIGDTYLKVNIESS
jgi:pSer/pThr/pTyr-binding forkhead associated (FHA) protein